MIGPRYAEAASKLLERQRHGLGASPSEAARAAAIQTVHSAILKHARRRRMRKISVAALVISCAAGAALVLNFWGKRGTSTPVVALATPPGVFALSSLVAEPRGTGATLWRASGETALSANEPIAVGSHLMTRIDGGVALNAKNGSVVSVAAASELSVLGSAERQIYALHRGSLSAKVAKLKPNERFMITTLDSEVEVRGTQFQVSLVNPEANCGSGTPTRVSVSEGLVVVRYDGKEDFVRPGEAWPTCTTPTKAAINTRNGVAPGNVGSPGNLAATRASLLAEQNDEFSQALALKNAGATAQALRALDRFIRKNPNCPLTEAALAERLRLLKTLSPDQAKNAADEYLARYPKGFARREAEVFLAKARP